MYNDGRMVHNFRHSWLKNHEGIVSGMTGACPAQTVDSISEFLAEIHIETNNTQVKSLVLKCYVTKPRFYKG